jgi:hypothetical protein
LQEQLLEITTTKYSNIIKWAYFKKYQKKVSTYTTNLLQLSIIPYKTHSKIWKSESVLLTEWWHKQIYSESQMSFEISRLCHQNRFTSNKYGIVVECSGCEGQWRIWMSWIAKTSWVFLIKIICIVVIIQILMSEIKFWR